MNATKSTAHSPVCYSPVIPTAELPQRAKCTLHACKAYHAATRTLLSRCRFTPLQGDVGKALLQQAGRAADDISSIVLVDEQGSYIKSDAILRISKALGGPAPVLAAPGFLMPQFARDTLYDLVANNRYSLMGKRETCRCSDPKYADRFI
eukprot:TRINITY_DN2708_c0_g1_i1.p1 TRINITY_DN2708_c0_g1~~TRINITY_DN2708_c0_g1_i1.p1  ORF type:complete len:150 (-),score=30.91 TRINITY_DN2708_c0_g1_i1:85-534(-)